MNADTNKHKSWRNRIESFFGKMVKTRSDST